MAASAGDATRKPVTIRPDTRNRILDGAVRAVARHGIAKLGMRDVSESAGVSRGTLYRYFPNRDDLLDELARREADAFLERVVDALRRAPAGEERLQVVLELALRELREHAALRRLLESDPAFVLHSLRERYPAIRAQLHELLAPLLEDMHPVQAGALSVDQLVDWTTRFLISIYLFEEGRPDEMAQAVTAMYRLLSGAPPRSPSAEAASEEDE